MGGDDAPDSAMAGMGFGGDGDCTGGALHGLVFVDGCAVDAIFLLCLIVGLCKIELRRMDLKPALTMRMLVTAMLGLVCVGAAGDVVGPAEPSRIEMDASGSTIFWFDEYIGNNRFHDGLGSAINDVLKLTNDPYWSFVRIAKLRWDVGISTVGNSWLSDATIDITTTGNSYALTPGLGFDEPGSASFSGEVDLREMGIEFIIMQGLLIEFYETFDDNPDGVDAYLYGDSFLSFGLIVPGPGAGVVILLGGLHGVRRRR